jgi:hypothetical protein
MICLSPEIGVAPYDRRSLGRDYGSAQAAFLGIGGVFTGKAGFLPGYEAAGCPIYDLFFSA